MNTTMTKNDNNTVTLTMTIEGDAWKKAQNKAVAKAAASMNIKGFRKGKVPAGTVRRMLGKAGVQQSAVDEVAQKSLDSLLKEYSDVKLIDRPTLEVPEMDDEKVVLSFTCPVAPEAALENWKNLGLEKKTAEVTDEEVDAEVEKLREAAAENELVEDGEGAVEGDSVTIDFVGTMNGEEFDGGSGKDVSLKLGSGQFIPGFEEQIVGIKPEEEREITVTFPEDYQVADLAGKEAQFKVTAHDIYRPILPELNDEFAKTITRFGDVETVDALKEAIKNSMLEARQDKLDDEFADELLSTLRRQADLNIPDVMVEDEINAQLRNLDARLRNSGLDLNTYLNLIRQDLSDLRDSLRDEARDRVANTLILDAIAREEGIEVTEADVEEALADTAAQMNMTADDIRGKVSMDALKDSLLYDKAMEALFNAQDSKAE